MPHVELELIRELTNKTIESAKITKNPIDTNEFIFNLKKVMHLKKVYELATAYIIPTAIVGICILYYFLSSNFVMGVIVFIVIMIFIFIIIHVEGNCTSSSHENQDTINELYDNIHDIISNVDTVITSDTIEKELDNIKNMNKELYENYVKSEDEGNNGAFLLRLTSLIVMIIIDGVAVYLYSIGSLDSSDLISIGLLAVMFMEYSNSTIFHFREALPDVGDYSLIREYFSQFKFSNEKGEDFVFGNGNMQFKNIGVSYDDKIIFDNFNLTINGGQKYGIRGPVGKGKTTLLKMLVGLLNYNGTITVDNQDIKKCSYESVMKHIVYIPQHPKLFNNTIYYNLNYGSDHTKEEIYNIIEKWGLSSFFNNLPDKIDTHVGKEGVKISGGQKQFISFIRSLIQNKNIILLDEPTSSLDPKTKQLFINLMKNIKNKTIIITTHDSIITDIFDKVINL